MRIAFFGSYGCFGHTGIGGTESIVRRLAYGIAQRGHQVGFVRVHAPESRLSSGPLRITTHDTRHLPEAFEALEGYDHVLYIYLRFPERLRFAAFRRKHENGTRFHVLLQSWAATPVRRILSAMDRVLIPYTGTVYAISPRLLDHSKRLGENAALMLPPVPTSYFLSPKAKPLRDELTVAYMGRLDWEKGADIAINLIRRLVRIHPSFRGVVYAYSWQGDRRGELLHEMLLGQTSVNYVATDTQISPLDADRISRRVLRQADFLILPYRNLRSTIDMPLVFLEGMAHLCSIIAPALGDLSAIYPDRLPAKGEFTSQGEIESRIMRTAASIGEERQRIFVANNRLDFSDESTTIRFLDSLEEPPSA